MIYNLLEIKKRAMKNAKERLVLIDNMRREVIGNKSLEEEINKIDNLFIRKLYYYPGDITTHRIAIVLKKIKR